MSSAVAFLRPSPRGVAEEIDADAGEEIRAVRARLDADRVADALLEVRIERRGARHRDRKLRRAPDDDAARPIGEADAFEAETRHRRGDVRPLVVVAPHAEDVEERQVAGEHAKLLVRGEPCDDVLDSSRAILRPDRRVHGDVPYHDGTRTRVATHACAGVLARVWDVP